ncbi:MAG: SpoIIE family protein phosphatase, partial [Actinomycetota bacterium]|nr:SpoIIE family protein phosphatase [Actinomycetota bacterium]
MTYCNQAFCEVAGYAEAELIGKPHNVIRHPDVPPEFFKDCWDTIQSGNSWHSIIKNRRSNGDYYWVEANVTPWEEGGKTVGYVSLRYKPTADQIAAAIAAYQAVREVGMVAVTSGEPDMRYIGQLQQRLANKVMQLEHYYDRLEQEQRVGSHIMGRLTQMPEHLESVVRRYTKPAEHLSGDALIATTTPAGTVHIMLADAVGHGLAAAINVLPLCRTFYAMTSKGFPLEKIAVELNMMVHQFMPVDRFVSTLLISINYHNRVIEVWNGGIPAPLLIDKSGQLVHRWPSKNLPLGIVTGDSFNSKPEVFRAQDSDCELYLYSDGLPEASSPQGEAFGEERILEVLLASSGKSRFDALIAGLESHLQGASAHDDVSLAMVGCGHGDEQGLLACAFQPNKVIEKDSDWRIAITLEASELKYLDVVPMITQVVSNIKATQSHHAALFLIMSELFNNALDHGVLQLDSSIKMGPDGFEQFLQMREMRLQALTSGKIS